MQKPGQDNINCWIYSTPRQDQMYLYLGQKDDFASLPSALVQHFGSPRLVMELTLHAERKLAREDVRKVIENIRVQGYHLQMPPKIDAILTDGE